MRKAIIAVVVLAATAIGATVVALPAEANPCSFTYCAPGCPTLFPKCRIIAPVSPRLPH